MASTISLANAVKAAVEEYFSGGEGVAREGGWVVKVIELKGRAREHPEGYVIQVTRK